MWETDDGDTIIDRGYDTYSEEVGSEDLVGEEAVHTLTEISQESFVLDCDERREHVVVEYTGINIGLSFRHFEEWSGDLEALKDSIEEETGLEAGGESMTLERTWPAVQAPPDEKKRVTFHDVRKVRRFEVISRPDEGEEASNFVLAYWVPFDIHMKTETFGTCEADVYIPLNDQLGEIRTVYDPDDIAYGHVGTAKDHIESAISDSTAANEDGGDVALETIDETLMASKADAVESLAAAEQHHERDPPLVSVATEILDIADQVADAKLSFTIGNELEGVPNPYVEEASSALQTARAVRDGDDGDGSVGEVWTEAMGLYEQAVSSNRQAADFYEETIDTISVPDGEELPPEVDFDVEPVGITDISVPETIDEGSEFTVMVGFDTEAEHAFSVSLLDGDELVSFDVHLTDTDGTGSAPVSAPSHGGYRLVVQSLDDARDIPLTVATEATSAPASPATPEETSTTVEEDAAGPWILGTVASLAGAGYLFKRLHARQSGEDE